MKKFLILTMAFLVFGLSACTEESTTTTLPAITTTTTTIPPTTTAPTFPTETTTSADPAAIALLYGGISARWEEITASTGIGPIDNVDGLYSRTAIEEARSEYVAAKGDSPLSFFHLENLMGPIFEEIGEILNQESTPTYGATYLATGIKEYPGGWINSWLTQITFSSDPAETLLYVRRTFYGDSLDALTGQGITAVKIGYDGEGKIMVELFSATRNQETGEIDKYYFFRYHEGVEFFYLLDAYLCESFSLLDQSLADGSVIQFFSFPDECDREQVYGRDYGVSFRGVGDNVRTGVHFEDGQPTSFQLSVYDGKMIAFSALLRFGASPFSQWDLSWTLNNATGWDALFVDTDNEVFLRNGETDLPLPGLDFILGTGSIYFQMTAEATEFTAAILDLSAYGLDFTAAELDPEAIEAYRTGAIAAAEDRMVYEGVDFHQGNPWEKAKAFLPEWVNDLWERSFGPME